MKPLRKMLVAVLGMLGSAASGQGAVFSTLPPDRSTLSDYKWEARPLLIFSSSPQDPDLKDQLSELKEARDGLLDRDMVILTDTNPDAHGKLRAGLAVDGFEIVLVGKDGSVKLRETKPLTARTLFDTIDAMPMRQRELRAGE